MCQWDRAGWMTLLLLPVMKIYAALKRIHMLPYLSSFPPVMGRFRSIPCILLPLLELALPFMLTCVPPSGHLVICSMFLVSFIGVSKHLSNSHFLKDIYFAF